MSTKAHTAPQNGMKKEPDAAAVAAGLREAIANGDLVPNQRLVETDLTSQFRASRGNVRAALAELTTEGLVERIQNRGARVRVVSLAEAVEIIEVRAALESLCAAKAAESITDDEIVELQTLGQAMSDAVATGDHLLYSTCNKKLHRRLMEISRQETATGLIARLRVQSVHHQFRLQPDRPNVSLPEHLEIINSVCAKDAERASSAMEAHLKSVASAVIRAGEASIENEALQEYE